MRNSDLRKINSAIGNITCFSFYLGSVSNKFSFRVSLGIDFERNENNPLDFLEVHVYETDFSVTARVIVRKSRNNRILRIIDCQRTYLWVVFERVWKDRIFKKRTFFSINHISKCRVNRMWRKNQRL